MRKILFSQAICEVMASAKALVVSNGNTFATDR